MATDVSTLLKTTYNETTAASELQMLKEIFNSIDLLGSSRAQKIQQLKQDTEEWEHRVNQMKLKHDAASAKLDELKYKENIFDFEQMRAKLDEETTALNISVQSLDDQCVVVTNEIDLVEGQLSEKYVDQNAIRLKIYRGLGFEWINEHGENDEARLRKMKQILSSAKNCGL
ncbi:hypothetical protein MP638_005491 [Amoeboaphelidium occidentale]|nr:hypothetical protein MP638_005491 [Amoeboaphelidium occidentale]